MLQKSIIYGDNFLKFWAFINIPWSHNSSALINIPWSHNSSRTKCVPDRFSRLDVQDTDRQANRHPDKQSMYIDVFLPVTLCRFEMNYSEFSPDKLFSFSWISWIENVMKNDGGGVTYKEINSFIQAGNWVLKQSNSGGGGLTIIIIIITIRQNSEIFHHSLQSRQNEMVY